LGARVFFLTELGDDADGTQLLAEITGRGVQPDGIRMLENTGSYFTLIFTDREESTPRQVATYLGPLGAMSVRDLDAPRFIRKSQLVYSCNYFQLLTVREEIGEVFARAREAGTTTAYDANGGDGWEDRENLKLLEHSIYPQTDIVFLNETEARALTGEPDPLCAAERASPGSQIVVIKAGAAGIVIREKGRLFRCPAFPIAGGVRDTVGAGDSFQAAFLFFYLKGFPCVRAAIFGAANGASTVQFPGGVAGQLDRRALADMISRYTVQVDRDDQVEILLND
jgi:sugar/nucleoside kinase (ribokinase family)